MKILHISKTMGQGGAEKVVLELCSLNRKQDYQMVVASSGGPNVDKLRKYGVKHYSIPDIASKNPFDMLKCFFSIFHIIIKENVQIVHSHHRMAAFYARLLCILKPSLKHIYTAHNVFKDKRSFTHFALNGAMLVAVGSGVKDNLCNYFGVNSKRVRIIYNSIYVPNVIPKSHVTEKLIELKKQGYYLIGNIGRISFQKGMDIFVKALAGAIKDNSRLVGVIVGNGECKGKIEDLASDLNIADRILFLGYQSNVYSILRELDFVVLSSRWEGFPLTPIETFAMHKTIIASNISGNNEIIDDGENGLLFESKDNVMLANQIVRLSNDPTLKEYLENNAYKTYQQRYSYEKFLKKYQKIYSLM